MIAQQRKLELHAGVDAFAWVRAITNNVTQAKNRFDFELSDVFQDRLKSFQVAMDITDYGVRLQRCFPKLVY